MPEPVIPDYGGAHLCGVIPGILLASPGRRPSWFPEPLQRANRTVLLLIDGLGHHQLTERTTAASASTGNLAPTLTTFSSSTITTVAPSTTASALTSLVTGTSPLDHGIVGYRMDMGRGDIMNSLRWHNGTRDLRPVYPPSDVQPIPPFAGYRVPVVSRAELEGTGFTEAHLRGSRPIGWRTVSSLITQVVRALDGGSDFVYAYYDGIDKIAHEYGFGDFYDNELAFVDRLVESLLGSLPTDTTLAVTADHGQVQVDDRIIELDPTVLGCVSHQSGEGRFRWLHAPVSRRTDLLARCLDLYSDVAWVVTKDRILDERWLGPAQGGSARDDVVRRLGDVALVPFAPVSFHDPLDSGPFSLVCRHGSLTEHEMHVPLLARTV